MTSLLLSRCRAVACMDDGRTELHDCSIVVQDGWITYLGKNEPNGQFDRTIDCRRFLAIPGLVNTHHHLYQTLTRGFAQSSGRPLFSWLEELYPIWAGLDEEMIRASTLAGLAELALSGCTTCADHLYVFPRGSDCFIDAQVESARDVGLRLCATRGSMDLSRKDGGLPPDAVVQSRIAILADSERVVNQYHDNAPGAMTQIALAPCSPFSVTPELMMETAGLARDLGVRLHTHLAETVDEDQYSRQTFGSSPVELVERLGWLADDVWLAHCVHLSDADIDRFAAKGVGVAHCPTSNMLLASGIARVRDMLDAGVTVGLGVDGSASNDSNDLRQEVKQAILSARVRNGANAMSVRDALFLATRGGAACLGRDDVGSLQPGKAADIALFDLDSLACAGGEEDPVAVVVLASPRVHTLIVHGRIVVSGGQLQTADVDETAAHHREASSRLMHKWRVSA